MDGQTDGQTDVGHINLIGGLVTCNPPKNDRKMSALSCNQCSKAETVNHSSF